MNARGVSSSFLADFFFDFERREDLVGRSLEVGSQKYIIRAVKILNTVTVGIDECKMIESGRGHEHMVSQQQV